MEGGSVLTDRALVTYTMNENDELAVYELSFDEISSIELVETGNSLADSIYRVTGSAEDAWLDIALSGDGGGDKAFIRALREKVSLAAS